MPPGIRLPPPALVPAVLLAVLLAAPAALSAAATPAGPDAPDPDWRTGPVRYILVAKEDQTYKALRTDDERAAFIESFWAALDPTPGTDENEKRIEFWKRVEDSNRMFREGMDPGWKSERGKFYILLGPPDERLTPGGPWEEWKYVALASPDSDPEVTFRFRRNSEGEYHAGTLKFEYWDPAQESAGPAAGDTFLAVRAANGTREMSKGRIRMPALKADVAVGFVTAPLEHRVRLDFYKVKKGSTRVVVTLALPKAQFKTADAGFEPPDMTLSVAIDDPKKGKPVGSYSEPMRLVGGASTLMDRPIVLQGSFTIEPGAYRAALNMMDRKSHRGISRSEVIEAPDFGRGLALSSIALGRLREEPPAAGGAQDTTGAPLVPEPDSVFHAGESILLAYEVYDANRGGRTKPDLDVEYTFFVKTPTGPRQAGKPVTLKHQASESFGYSLSLRGWPAGAFRVRVRVTDARNGDTAEREASFRVESGG